MSEALGLLTIQSPLHGELQVSIEQTLTVGRSTASDIVLADASLLPLHFRLKVGDVPGIRLEALEGDILLEGGLYLTTGMNFLLRRTTNFNVGQIPFRIELRGFEEEPVPALKRRRKIPAVLVMAALGSSVFATAEGSSVSAHVLAPEVEASAPAAIKPERHVSESFSQPQALAELHRLNLDAVTLDPLGDGALRATGTIAASERPQWADFKKWLDAQSGGELVLVDAVANEGKAPALAIQSVWLGDTPYVIDGQGAKLFVGANIGDGWTISSIEPGRVNVSRAHRHVSVRF